MVKRALYYVVSIVCVFFSFYLLPGFLLIAFNYGKGIQNNEDGIMFIPFGFILLGLTILMNILLVRKALKMPRYYRYKQIVVVTVLVCIVIVAVILTASTWELFITCFNHYKGLNLGLQR